MVKDNEDYVHQSFWYNSNSVNLSESGCFALISTKDNFNPKNIKILSIDFETRQVAEDTRIRNQDILSLLGFLQTQDLAKQFI